MFDILLEKLTAANATSFDKTFLDCSQSSIFREDRERLIIEFDCSPSWFFYVSDARG